jgi:hypothetical protein
MFRFVPFIVVTTLACSAWCGAVAAEPKPAGQSSFFAGTPAEQRACARDATRLCAEEIPDNFAVLACLQKHRKKLHKSCLAVLEAHGQ